LQERRAVVGEVDTAAKGTLFSYDSSREPVTVLRLTRGAVMVREWSGTSAVGEGRPRRHGGGPSRE